MDSFSFQRFTVAFWAAGLATLVAACGTDGVDHSVPTVGTKKSELLDSCPGTPLPAGSAWSSTAMRWKAALQT